MNRYGISVELKNIPSLDPSFLPLHRFNEEFLKTAKKKVGIAVEREEGQIAAYSTFVHGDEAHREADTCYIDRLIKCILWMKGGFRIFISGDREIYETVRAAYSVGGSRDFDRDFMQRVYEKPFEVLFVDELPCEHSAAKAVGRHLAGCRIGFDAGGSDRKVSAVVDGETVFSEEVVWFPKITEDPDYHYDGIVSAFKSAAEHMPRVDAVGISSAGVYVSDRTMVASLFLKVPEDLFEAKVKDIYIRAVRDTFGDIPYAVCNDGDVSALAGAMSMNKNSVLGIAMGTSQAVGFVDAAGNITGWLNELAFMPVDVSADAVIDEWSGDFGCGVKYFSQDAVIKLAPRAGIELDEDLSPAEKLKVVQKLMEEGDERAAKIYETLGIYLGHALAFYYELYGCTSVLLLGRVMSGKGGDLLLANAKHVLADEYPAISDNMSVELPNEMFRRVGQSMAAASLPELKK